MRRAQHAREELPQQVARLNLRAHNSAPRVRGDEHLAHCASRDRDYDLSWLQTRACMGARINDY